MKKTTYLVLLFVWPILASLISFLVNANFFVTTILFLGVPSVFLSFLNRKNVKKLVIFSMFSAIPICIAINYIMGASGGWHVNSYFNPFRMFDFMTIDLALWGILESYFILIFYETFLDRQASSRLYYPLLKYLLIIFYIALSVFTLIYMFNPAVLRINYFYLKGGITLVALSVAGMLLKFPKFWNIFLNMAVYFFVFNFIYEVTAVKLGQWSFPTEHQFIGIVQFTGVRFAFEEILFWIILTAVAIVTFHELFDDDQK